MTLILTDAQLLKRIDQADEAALLELHARYASLVYSVAYRVLNDRMAAEEVTQDTFLRLWNKAHTYDSAKGAFVPWLLTITRRLAIDLFRKQRRDPMAQTLLIAVGDTGERLRPKILDRIAKLKVGDGMAPGTDMGPIYSKEHRASVIDWIDIGEQEGAELVVDGRTFQNPDAPEGFFLGVSLFDKVTPEMKIYQEEIFGPVFGIVHADTFDEAMDLVNGHKYANGTAIFTTNGGAARRFKLEAEVPMIGVNVPIPVPAGYMSFGGAKDSAIGDLAMRGEDGVRFFTQQKMVTERWPEPGKEGPLSLVFPGNA